MQFLQKKTIALIAIISVVATACGGPAQQTPGISTGAPTASAAAADKEPSAALIKAAQQEGEVVLYSGKSEADLQKLAAAFKAKYGINVVYRRSASGANQELAAQQLSSGNVLVDLIMFTRHPEFEATWQSKFVPLTTADIPNLALVPEDQKSSTFVGGSLGYYGFVYNTDDLKAADLPKDIFALASMTKLKGRVGTANPSASNSYATWHAILYDAWGKTKYEQFIQGFIGDQRARLADAASTLVNLVAAGELSIVGPTNWGQAQPIAEKGAPVAIHYFDPVMSLPDAWVILGGSPHPNAAKLWLNWMLSAEGQEGLCSAERCASYRDDIKTAIKAPAGTKIVQAPTERGIELGKSYIIPLVQRVSGK